MEILGFDNKNSFRFGFCHFLKYQSCTNYVFLQLFMMLCTTQIYVFIFKTCKSKLKRDLTNSLSEWKHIADTKSNNSVFHAVLKSIFQKLDFSFYTSYFHMKTAPPMNNWVLKWKIWFFKNTLQNSIKRWVIAFSISNIISFTQGISQILL